MIEGVKIIDLEQFPDERGKVMHMLKVTDPHFEKFGEIYFSMAYPDMIKGWHSHKRMTLNYACVTGKIKLVLYDNRKNSSTKGEFQEIFLGTDNYKLVSIPPNIINGWKACSEMPAIVANCATEVHDTEEIEYFHPFNNDIPYDWNKKYK